MKKCTSNSLNHVKLTAQSAPNNLTVQMIRDLGKKEAICKSIDATTIDSFPEKSSGYFRSRYRILETLGSGNFGIVYKCTDLQSTNLKAVCIKKISPKAAVGIEKDAKKIGTEELKMLELIKANPKRHAHLQILLDFFFSENKYFIVTEYVDGVSMFQAIESRSHHHQPPSPITVKRIATGILLALKYLHKKGIAHVDVKPSNIMLAGYNVEHGSFKSSSSGRAVLIDVGIACVTSNPPRYPRCDERHAGTIVYMSPEIVHHALKYLPLIEYTSGLYKSNDVYGFALSMYEFIVSNEYGVVGLYNKAAAKRKLTISNRMSEMVASAGHFAVAEMGDFYPQKLRFEKILKSLLVQRHTLRPSAARALNLFRVTSLRVPNLNHVKPLAEYIGGGVEVARKNTSSTSMKRVMPKDGDAYYGEML